MVVKYWPAAAQREENASPFLVKQIERNSISAYLKAGRRFTAKGVTLYIRPTDNLEVGFLIRRRAGKAVKRNHTRRLFRGFLLNSHFPFELEQGYLFLFHRSYMNGSVLEKTLIQLIARAENVS